MPTVYDGSSSPDPLNSFTCTKNSIAQSKKRTSTSATRRSGVARRSLDNVLTLPPSSPSRTVTEQVISPWKIRVTVEAEPEDQEHGLLQTTTRTMKIPLREEDLPTQHKNTGRRTQNRSRTNSVTNERQRSTTPTSGRSRRQSVTDLDIVVLGDDADEDEWGKRPKKSSPRKNRAQKTVPKLQTDNSAQSQVTDFEVRHDTDAEEIYGVAAREESPELRQIDLNKVSVRSRANSVKQTLELPDDAESEDTISRMLKPLPVINSAARRTVSANSGMTYPTPSPTASERGHSVEVEEHQKYDHAEGFDTIMESEGFTMIDLESLPSVKQMLSSPAEVQTTGPKMSTASSSGSETSVLKHTPSSATRQPFSQTRPASGHAPYLILPEGESDISSTVPSSPPSFQSRIQPVRQKAPLDYLQVPVQPRNRVVTPQPYESPKLPSPPRQMTLKDRSTPDSAKALRAAMVLQGAIKKPNLYPALPSLKQPVPKDTPHSGSSSDEVFEGFDSGTKRELRAGLRFGEELARRQASSTATTASHVQQSSTQPTSIWRGESTVARTPLQAESHQSHNSDEVLSEQSKRSYHTSDVQSTARTYPDSNTRRQNEQQIERRDVSERINNASPSNVVVIESDEESSYDEQGSDVENMTIKDITMEDDGDDIWLEEAKDASSSPRSEQEVFGMSLQPAHQHCNEHSTQEKPRRGLIPSPWKHGDQIEPSNNSTIINNADDFSGMLWDRQAQDDIQFGAAAISNVRKELEKSGNVDLVERRASGAFNVEKMLGTPKRIRESLAKEQTRGDTISYRGRHSARQQVEHHSDEDIVEEQYDDSEVDVVEEVYVVNEDESTPSVEPHVPTHEGLQTIPVNFNDSATSQAQTSPPRAVKARASLSPSAIRPPTPRSAMKGSRQSFGATSGCGVLADEDDQTARRVIFAQRSKGVNVDWVESSSSIRSSADDVASSPIINHQKHHDERQMLHTSSQVEPESELNFKPGLSACQNLEAAGTQSAQDEIVNQTPKGWFGWFRKGQQTRPDANQSATATAKQIDGSSESPQSYAQLQETHDTIWAPTSRHDMKASHTRDQQKPGPQPPSYLLPPSYPSDPTRNPRKPLATFGSFTNTHFRTLHILHRKSQRPRFHAPTLNTCRPEIRALAFQKWKLEVDESTSGLGEFAWTVGAIEARVLERFCQELELGHLSEGLHESEVAVLMERSWTTDEGIWGGSVMHGQGGVRWEWSATQLATWLGRIVVGEVVRAEEYGSKKA